MRTKEFIKRVEELGFKVIDGIASLMIIAENNECARVYENTMYSINTSTRVFDEIDKGVQKNLFNLIVEYASTPIKERKEEKKYLLKHKWLQGYDNLSYLNLSLNTNKKRKCYLYDSVDASLVKTQFTQSEIDEIKERFNTNLEDFEIVEVEE